MDGYWMSEYRQISDDEQNNKGIKFHIKFPD